MRSTTPSLSRGASVLALIAALGAAAAWPAASGPVFHASPTGSPAGTGSLATPWDLWTALSRNDTQVPAGSTLYLRGGTYRGIFRSTLRGTVDGPIVVRPYPGERVVIDGYETTPLLEALPLADRGTVFTVRIGLPRPLEPASLLVVEGEELYIASVESANSYRCIRGWNGSPIRAHAAGTVVAIGAGTILTVEGPYVWFWDLEVTSSFTERVVGSSGGQTAVSLKPGGYNLRAPGVKVIDNLIHDVGHPAIAFFSPAEGCDVPNDALGRNPCAEVYGTLVWGNGYYDATRGGQPIGSAVYTQNRVGTKYLRDNIFFRNFTTGVNIYTEGGYVNNFHVEGNASFDHALYDIWATGAALEPMRNLKVIHNYTFRRPADAVSSSQFGFTAVQGDMVFAHNYVVGGAENPVFVANNFTGSMEVTDNTFVSTGPNGRLAVLRAPASPPPSSYFWDRNDYYDAGSTVYTFGFNTATNRLGGGYLQFDDPGTALGKGWRQWTGFDAQSRYSFGAPRDLPSTAFREDLRVFVRPNVYERGRGHVVVYNWTPETAVAVDLSSVLTPGARYEIRDAQNYSPAPLLTGTFNGALVTLPLNLTAVRPLAGNVTHLQLSHTAPRFAVFVVESVSPAPTPTPTPVPTPTPTPTPTPSPTPPAFPIYLEAESAALAAPMASAADPQASGGRYVSSPTRDQGTARFTVTVPRTGNYYLWGRVLSPDSGKDSLFVSVDGASEDIWDTAEELWSASWQWTRVTGRAANGGSPSPRNQNPRVFGLSAGAHSFTFRGRDPETRFDRLFVTDSAAAAP